MAISIAYQTQESMTFEDFMEYADRNVDFTNQEQLLALGEQLTMLGNNRTFLTDFISWHIEQSIGKLEVPGVISQAAEMARTKNFYVRFAVWMPGDNLRPQESVLFAYDQAHDHNFDLLSLAYCGSGYQTDIYEYDYDSVQGFVGERVALKPLGNHRHKAGDVLLYRCSKDIHFQRPPETPSVTLNVVPLQNEHGLIDQYFFDIPDRWSESGVILRHADNNMELRKSLYDIASHFPTPKVVRLLADVVEASPCKRSRREALRALSRCDEDAFVTLYERYQVDSGMAPDALERAVFGEAARQRRDVV